MLIEFSFWLLSQVITGGSTITWVDCRNPSEMSLMINFMKGGSTVVPVYFSGNNGQLCVTQGYVQPLVLITEVVVEIQVNRRGRIRNMDK